MKKYSKTNDSVNTIKLPQIPKNNKTQTDPTSKSIAIKLHIKFIMHGRIIDRMNTVLKNKRGWSLNLLTYCYLS